ncbi:MAG TPA: peptide ABC transporter ATP-binding protein, partial [Pantoea sp.]|nr:peptide ABC transporter ATP-binding protein [Pantoea sp.]
MLVEIENLRIAFRSRAERFEAVRGVSFRVGKEKFAIVGESGSGKSLTARSLMQLLPGNAEVSADTLRFDGIDLRGASEKTLRQIRGRRVGFILQDPKYSLNPVMTIGQQIAEAWREHKGGSRKAAMQAAIGLLEQVKIRDAAAVALRYPHEVSGGMGQR